MNTDTNCAPACAPNTPANLPIAADPGCDRPTPVKICPGDGTLTAEKETCIGSEIVPITQTVEAVIPSGTIVYTRRCPGDTEFDHQVLCAPDGTKVVVVVTYEPLTGVPTSSFYDLSGIAWTGDPATLRTCDEDIESDPVIWCSGGQEYTQWVVKSDGVPTGEIYWTDSLTGTIQSAAPPAPTLGACGCINEPFIGVITDLSIL